MSSSSPFLAAVAERVSSTTAPPAPGCRPRTCTPTTTAASTTRAAPSCWPSPGPTSSPPCTPRTSRSGPTSSRPTPSGRCPAPSPSTRSPSGPRSCREANARIAREVADGFATPDKPRFVAGSIGPGTKSPSLGQIPFADLRDGFEVQARGLLNGGVDLLLIETQFDLLGAKAAMIGARRAMAAVGREVPLQVQVTIELTGRMLLGTEIGGALTALDAMAPDVIGINCATGPAEMGEHIRYLSQLQPPADLRAAQRRAPVGGRRQDALRPHGAPALRAPQAVRHRSSGSRSSAAAAAPRPSTSSCSSTRCRGLEPARRQPTFEPGLASIYSHVPYDQAPSFLVVGERTNANGSKKFREAMLEGDWDTTVAMAAEQVKEGSHVIDVCVDYVGRDGTADMAEVASRFATAATVPLMVDSTEPDVVETALQHIGGKAILNSVNLEDGDAPGTRLDRFLALAKEYGAAVVATCIDEEGQARTPEWKLRAARAIYDIAVDRYGLEPHRHLLRPPRPHPRHGHRGEPRRRHVHHRGHPAHQGASCPASARSSASRTSASASTPPPARRSTRCSCTSARRPASTPPSSTPPASCRSAGCPRSRCRPASTSIYDRRAPRPRARRRVRPAHPPHGAHRGRHHDRRREGGPLGLAGRAAPLAAHHRRRPQRPHRRPRRGHGAAGLAPLAIINDVLLAGMKVVGELFGSGQMQLPFVLQSAETMKAAVAHLEPHMEKARAGGVTKGRIVLATVKGDVHDIGKNLVDIILTNNGYEVHNLGIKVSPRRDDREGARDRRRRHRDERPAREVHAHHAREPRGAERHATCRTIPVLLGGAALTRSYVERDLRGVYDGRLFYGKDAFEGLSVMDRLGAMRRGERRRRPGLGHRSRRSPRCRRRSSASDDDADVELPARVARGRRPTTRSSSRRSSGTEGGQGHLDRRDRGVHQRDGAVPQPVGLPAREGRRRQNEDDAAFKERIRPILRDELAKATAAGILVPQVVYGYFPAIGRRPGAS